MTWDPFRLACVHVHTREFECGKSSAGPGAYAEFGEPEGLIPRGGKHVMVPLHRVRRGAIYVDYEGERITLPQLARRTGLTYGTLYDRMLRGKPLVTESSP